MPERRARPEPIKPNLHTQGTTMPSKLQTSGWIAFAAALITLAVTAVASFSGGVHIEAGGVHMTLQADLESGLQLVFAGVES